MSASKKSILVTIIFCSALIVHGQNYINSLNTYSSLSYYPAFAAVDNAASLSYLNKKTVIGPGASYQLNSVMGEFPLIEKKAGKRYGGIGVQFIEKDAGVDLLNSNAFSVSLAYNLQLKKEQYIAFGIQPAYYNKSTSLKNFTTGNQWLANEFRFDSGAPIGEALTVNRINYFALNAGLTWYLEDKHQLGAHKAFASLTSFNMNRPNESFFDGQSTMPVSWLLQAGGILYHSKSFRFTPQVIVQRVVTRNSFNAITSSQLFFTNNNPYDVIQSGSVELITNYNLKNDLSLGVAFNQPSVSLGFSYNIALSGKTSDQYFQNGIEFGISLKKTIWKEKIKTIIIEEKPENKRNFDFRKPSPNNAKTPEVKPETTIIQKNIEEYSKVKAVQFQLDKNFKFQYGGTELSSDAKEYLNELAKLLQDNPDYKLEVIGHTDNVGKHLVNYRLSVGRAQAVAEYLIQQGLSKDRIKYSGRGDTDAAAPNDTEENRARNRRVQFIIYIDK